MDKCYRLVPIGIVLTSVFNCLNFCFISFSLSSFNEFKSNILVSLFFICNSISNNLISISANC